MAARGLDQLEAVIGAAAGGGGVGRLEHIGGLLGRALDLLVVVLGLRDALLGDLAEGGAGLPFSASSNFGISNFGISNFGISKLGAATATGFGLDFWRWLVVASAMTVILGSEDGIRLSSEPPPSVYRLAPVSRPAATWGAKEASRRVL